MKTRWQMVRLDFLTHKRLVAFLDTWRSWKEDSLLGGAKKFAKRPALADAIDELLDRVAKHKARSRKHAKQAKQSSPTTAAGDGLVGDAGDQVSFNDRINAAIAADEPFEPVLDLE